MSELYTTAIPGKSEKPADPPPAENDFRKVFSKEFSTSAGSNEFLAEIAVYTIAFRLQEKLPDIM